MRESTGLQGALPASLIIHRRPVYLQTAGILTNVFLFPFTDFPFLRLSFWAVCDSHIFGCVVMRCLSFSSLCVCFFVLVFVLNINDLWTRHPVLSRGQLGEIEDVSCLSSNRFAQYSMWLVISSISNVLCISYLYFSITENWLCRRVVDLYPTTTRTWLCL